MARLLPLGCHIFLQCQHQKQQVLNKFVDFLPLITLASRHELIANCDGNGQYDHDSNVVKVATSKKAKLS